MLASLLPVVALWLAPHVTPMPRSGVLQMTATPSGMSVAQACAFMASADGTPEEKLAFLTAKGVSAFVIAQAECTAPADNVQGHPTLPTTTSVQSWYDAGQRLLHVDSGTSAKAAPAVKVAPPGGWPMVGGVNTWHRMSGPWPKAPPGTPLDEAAWPKRPPPDYLGRPTFINLSAEQAAAYGGSTTRKLTYPTFEEEAAFLTTAADELAGSLTADAEEVNRLLLSMIESRAQLGAVNEALAVVAAAEAAAKEEALAASKAPVLKTAPSATMEIPELNGGTLGGLAALLVAAGAAYYYQAGSVVDAVANQLS